MLLPNKHIRVAESILGLAAYQLTLLKKPSSIDEIWAQFQSVNNSDDFPAHQGFDNFVLGLDLLFMIGALVIDGKGRLTRAAN